MNKEKCLEVKQEMETKFATFSCNASFKRDTTTTTGYQLLTPLVSRKLISLQAAAFKDTELSKVWSAEPC